MTVTVQEAVLPFEVLPFITAVPVPRALMLPALTEATPAFELVQVTALFVVLSGDTEAESAYVSPFPRDTEVLLRETDRAYISGAFTVSLQTAHRPLEVSAFISAVPGATPVTFPALTTAIFVSELVHFTVLFVVFEGVIVGVRVIEFPLLTEAEVLFRVIPFALTTVVSLKEKPFLSAYI